MPYEPDEVGEGCVDGDGLEYDLSEHTRARDDVCDRICKGWHAIRTLQMLGGYTEEQAVVELDTFFASLLGDDVPDLIFEEILGVSKVEYVLLDREAKDAAHLYAAR